MNYKQMVLLEELVDIFLQGRYTVTFRMDYTLCAGTFRKNKIAGIEINQSKTALIHTEKLKRDFTWFLEGSEVIFDDFFDHVRENNDYAIEKSKNLVLAHFTLFLTQNNDILDVYLEGYDGPQVIYHLLKWNRYYEFSIIEGMQIDPIELIDVVGED